jgi:hypothetical protein
MTHSYWFVHLWQVRAKSPDATLAFPSDWLGVWPGSGGIANS